MIGDYNPNAYTTPGTPPRPPTLGNAGMNRMAAGGNATMGFARPDRGGIQSLPGAMPRKPGGVMTMPGLPGKFPPLPGLPGKQPGQVFGALPGRVAGPASWHAVGNLWQRQQALQGQAGMGDRIADLDARRRAMMAQLQQQPGPVKSPPIYAPPLGRGGGGNTGIVPPWMRGGSGGIYAGGPRQSPPIYAPRPQIPEAGMIGINPRPGGVYF